MVEHSSDELRRRVVDDEYTAAAMHGIAANKAFPVADRLQAALQALEFYAERAGRAAGPSKEEQ